MMRSLICLEHPDFDGTLRRIESEGGKAGSGMYLFPLKSSTPLNYIYCD